MGRVIDEIVRETCRQEFAQVLQDNATQGFQLEKYVWQLSQGDAQIYEAKFKQLHHNLRLNAAFLLQKYPLEILVSLDDIHLAENTIFEQQHVEHVRQRQIFQQVLEQHDEVVKVAEQKDKELLGDAKILMKCRSCGSENVNVELKQTRSADEPMTQFYTCRECETTWKR